MTLYEYRCGSCNATLEEFFPLGKAPDTLTCDCQSAARRLPARGAFLTFPGSYNASK